jgi:hypothetical protein
MVVVKNINFDIIDCYPNLILGLLVLTFLLQHCKKEERKRERGKEGKRERGKERKREREKEGKRERGKEGKRERGKERKRER